MTSSPKTVDLSDHRWGPQRCFYNEPLRIYTEILRVANAGAVHSVKCLVTPLLMVVVSY